MTRKTYRDHVADAHHRLRWWRWAFAAAIIGGAFLAVLLNQAGK